MGLPDLRLPRKTIELAGDRRVEIRALSHGEALEVAELMGDHENLETMPPEDQRRFQTFVLKAAFDEDDDEAIAAFIAGKDGRGVTTGDVVALVQGVLNASGLGEDETGRPTATPSPDG